MFSIFLNEKKQCGVQDRDAERRGKGLGPQCHFFNSFFLNKLYKDTRTYNYKAVQRWTLPKKLKLQNQARTCYKSSAQKS